jgi:F-type H+-transporting ATPase subunit epsilon
MAERLRLEVVTPRRQLLDVEADEVRLPGELGELGVLPGHTPLLTSLGTGPLSYLDGGTATRLVVQGGFAEVLPDHVTVLAALAEARDEIDAEAARAERSAAEEELKSADAEQLDEITARLRLAETRIEVGG